MAGAGKNINRTNRKGSAICSGGFFPTHWYVRNSVLPIVRQRSSATVADGIGRTNNALARWVAREICGALSSG
jgi:hypothetical protein